MVPASAEYGVPGADDEAIFADVVRSLGRDRDAVRKALAMLREIAGGDFRLAGEGVIVLGYTAEGHRQGAEPYRRFCTSIYRSGRLLREH